LDALRQGPMMKAQESAKVRCPLGRRQGDGLE
jgi:hypothetical protein